MLKMENARVLVTGGSGFMGTHLVESLARDRIFVANLDNKPPRLPAHVRYWTAVDLLDYEQVRAAFSTVLPTHVVHLAARTDLDEEKDLEGYAVNFRGVENLIRAMEKTDTVQRSIITSSMLVCRLGYKPTGDEDYAPANLYGISKVLTEKITRRSNPASIWTIIRPTTIWGPYHDLLKNGFLAALQKGLYLHPGANPCLKSYGYVGNSIFQIRKLLMAPASVVHRQTLYISDPPINLREWAGQVSKKLVGRDVTVAPLWLMRGGALLGDAASRMGIQKVPLTTFRLRNMITPNVLDIEPITTIAGPGPYTVAEGIEATVAWLTRKER